MADDRSSPEPDRGRLDADVRPEARFALDRPQASAVGADDLGRLALAGDLLAEDVDRRQLAARRSAPAVVSTASVEARARDVARRDPSHDRLRHDGQDAGDRLVDQAPRPRRVYEPRRLAPLELEHQPPQEPVQLLLLLLGERRRDQRLLRRLRADRRAPRLPASVSSTWTRAPVVGSGRAARAPPPRAGRAGSSSPRSRGPCASRADRPCGADRARGGASEELPFAAASPWSASVSSSMLLRRRWRPMIRSTIPSTSQSMSGCRSVCSRKRSTWSVSICAMCEVSM